MQGSNGATPMRRKQRSARPFPKGRQVDPKALESVRALLAGAPRRRDLLIEHLHRIQDAHGGISPDAHLAALASEMRLSQAEVFEVATFYAHFDILARRACRRTPDHTGVRQPDLRDDGIAAAEDRIGGDAGRCGPGGVGTLHGPMPSVPRRSRSGIGTWITQPRPRSRPRSRPATPRPRLPITGRWRPTKPTAADMPS